MRAVDDSLDRIDLGGLAPACLGADVNGKLAVAGGEGDGVAGGGPGGGAIPPSAAAWAVRQDIQISLAAEPVDHVDAAFGRRGNHSVVREQHEISGVVG